MVDVGNGVHTRPAVHRVGAGAADEQVVAFAALQQVVALVTGEVVRAVVATQDVVEVRAVEVFDGDEDIPQRVAAGSRRVAQVQRDGAAGCDVAGGVDARATVELVGTRAADQDVGIGAASELVVAGFAVEQVEARAAVQHIVTGAAIEEVMADITGQCVGAGPAPQVVVAEATAQHRACEHVVGEHQHVVLLTAVGADLAASAQGVGLRCQGKRQHAHGLGARCAGDMLDAEELGRVGVVAADAQWCVQADVQRQISAEQSCQHGLVNAVASGIAGGAVEVHQLGARAVVVEAV